jgi:hypothetical protein
MPAVSRTILGLVGAAAFAVIACSGSSPATNPPVPSIALPSFAIPSIAIPSIAIPSVAIPSIAIPSVALPSGAVPSFAFPSIALPPGIPGVGPVVDAGTILTPDAAGAIIGGQVTKAPVPTIPGLSIVGYSNENGDSVSAYVQAVPAGMGTTMLGTAIQIAGGQGDLQTLSGLGDAAGKVVNANDAAVVFAKGATLVVVSASSGSTSGADLEPKIEAIAHQIEGRI